MLLKNTSLQDAEIVVAIVAARLNGSDEYENIHISVECFDNCREQGLVLIDYSTILRSPLHIAVARNRNSDSIVVYNYQKTDGASNLPAESEWDNKMFFDCGKYTAAAEHIIKLIISRQLLTIS